jgi:histidyl-tRNA synthetase
VYGVSLGAGAHREIFDLVVELRRTGVRADMSFGTRGLKGAMKAADRSGARYAILVGDAERAARVVMVRDLENGEQVAVPTAEVTAWLIGRLT